MKTKWGTCNVDARRIWINLELAKKSADSLEYVVMHELVHLLAKHHDDRFVTIMDKHLPRVEGSPRRVELPAIGARGVEGVMCNNSIVSSSLEGRKKSLAYLNPARLLGA